MMLALVASCGVSRSDSRHWGGQPSYGCLVVATRCWRWCWFLYVDLLAELPATSLPLFFQVKVPLFCSALTDWRWYV